MDHDVALEPFVMLIALEQRCVDTQHLHDLDELLALVSFLAVFSDHDQLDVVDTVDEHH